MGDIYTPEKRSEIMSRIRSSGTVPEERLFALVRLALGHRWRIDRNRNDLPGRPDIVVPSLMLVIFADGCFYHCCPIHGHIPKSNVRYWRGKLEHNARRDRANHRSLRKMGYAVWRFWEHDLGPSKIDRVAVILGRRIAKVLRRKNGRMEGRC